MSTHSKGSKELPWWRGLQVCCLQGPLFLLSLFKETRAPEMYTLEKGWHGAHVDYESSQDYQEAA